MLYARQIELKNKAQYDACVSLGREKIQNGESLSSKAKKLFKGGN